MCVYTCAYIYIHTHTCIYIHIHTHTQVLHEPDGCKASNHVRKPHVIVHDILGTPARMGTSGLIYICTYTYIYIYEYIYIYTHINIYVYTSSLSFPCTITCSSNSYDILGSPKTYIARITYAYKHHVMVLHACSHGYLKFNLPLYI